MCGDRFDFKIKLLHDVPMVHVYIVLFLNYYCILYIVLIIVLYNLNFRFKKLSIFFYYYFEIEPT